MSSVPASSEKETHPLEPLPAERAPLPRGGHLRPHLLADSDRLQGVRRRLRALPPQILFTPTLEQYASAMGDFWAPFLHSVIIVGVSTVVFAPGRPRGVRPQLLSRQQQREHRVLVHHDQGAAAGRGAGAFVRDIQDPATARHGLGAHHRLRRDEHADCSVDDVPVYEGSAEGDPGGGRWTG